jgi:hypothetical protein
MDTGPQQVIKDIHPGDTSLEASNFNAIADAARRVMAQSFNAVDFTVSDIGGALHVSLYKRIRWPGYLHLVTDRWYDADIAEDQSIGSAIIDNSSGVKTYLRISMTTKKCYYETGPAPYPIPLDEQWHLVIDLVQPFYVSRF